jgi:rsbT co-antagonist protein RsbR
MGDAGTNKEQLIRELRARIAELESATQPSDGVGEREAWAGTLLESLPDPIVLYDQSENVVYCNQAFEQVFGWSLEALRGKPIDFVPEESLAETRRATEQAYSGEPVRMFETHRLTHDQRTLDIQLSMATIFDKRGQPAGLITTLRDITASRQAEQQLRVFQALAEYAPDSIAVADLNSTIIFANSTFRRMMGYGDALVGMKINECINPKELPAQVAVSQQVRSQGTWQGIITFRRRDGSTFMAQSSLYAILDPNGRPQAITGIMHDITAQLQAEQERLALQEQIIQGQQAALRELSTPLIPLADGLVAMPLVGSIDSARAQQVIEALLEGVTAHHADTAIIDITGVAVVDTQVANALIRAAQAVRLLGARVILTGIRPEVAQTLVGIGLSLGAIVTRSTLQSGIAYALGRESV